MNDLIIKHKIKMELTGKEVTPCVEVVQHDSFSRILEIAMLENGLPVCLPETCSPVIRFRRADGFTASYDTMSDGETAWYIQGNVLGLMLVPEMCAVAGKTRLIVQLLDGREILYSFPVVVLVQENISGTSKLAPGGHLTGFLPQPEKAKAGKYVRIEQVDAKGRVTRTESVDIPAGGAIAAGQSDWNAAEGEPGHIVNRTHWVDEEYKVFLDTTVSTAENMATVVLNTELQHGENYTVTFMGQTYSCHCKYMKAMGQVALVIGNTLAIDGNNTGEPFAVAYIPWMGFTVVMTLLPDGDYPIKIEGNYKVYNKISRALLPKPIWVIDCDLDVDRPTVNVTQVELEPAIENGEFVALRDRMEGTTNFSILYFSGRSGGNLLFRQIPVGNGNAKYCILKPNISGGYDVVESII